MGKINKFSDKVQKIKRATTVDFATNEGDVISFAIQSRSSEEIDGLNDKYEALKPNVPSKKVPTGKGGFKVIENPNEPEYKKVVSGISKAHFNHMALMFLAEDERPEGTEEEQLKAISEVELAGFVGKIVTRGLEISGLTGDDDNDIGAEVEEERKN